MYKCLDLYCCSGGAAMGYYKAGFEVTGVDIIKRPRYPFKFIQADALEILKDKDFIDEFDFIHASPPCQMYTKLKNISGYSDAEWKSRHVDLVEPTRKLLEKTGKPYIIENVEGAPLINPIKLCGSQFDGLLTQRPRLFESNISLKKPNVPVTNMKTGKLGTISENGTVSVCGKNNLKGLNKVQTKLYYGIALGGIDWMELEELTECIPPAYTEFLGTQVIEYLNLKTYSFNMEEFIELVKKYIAV